jgi:hypothetical protein
METKILWKKKIVPLLPDSNTAPMNDKAHTLATDSAGKYSR